MPVAKRLNFSQDEMRRANGKYLVYPIYYYNEEFKRISDYIKEISDYYFISNYGRLFSGVGEQIKATEISNAGYEIINLITKDHKYKPFSIHRLVSICFHYIQNYHDYAVNHIDGSKLNNHELNLEWTTDSENMIHCYRNNMEVNGENHPWATITDEQAHHICQLLEQRYSYKEIARIVLGDENKYTLITNIKNGRSWVNISNQYNIPKTNSNKQRFTDDELYQIWNLVKTGMKPRDVAISMGIDIFSYSENDRERIYRIIRDIRDGKAYFHIPRD